MPNALDSLNAESRSRFDMLTHRFGLEAARPLLAPLVQPCVTFTRDPDVVPGDVRTDVLPLGASRIGGVPDLPRGWEWPILADGFVINDTKREPGYAGFLLQIALADVPEFPGNPLPRKGQLYVFELGPSRSTREGYRVLYSAAEVAELVRVPRPEGLPCAAELGFFELSEATPFSCSLGFDLSVQTTNEGELLTAIARVTQRQPLDADLLDSLFALIAAGRASYRDGLGAPDLPDGWLQVGRLLGALQVDAEQLPPSGGGHWRPLLTIMSNAAVDYMTPFDARDMQLLVQDRGPHSWTELHDVVSAVVE